MMWMFFAAGNTFLNPIFVIIGSLFPDADHRNAPIGRIVPLWMVFKHRGFTHTIWALIISALGVWLVFSWWSALSWSLGYFSHLFLDATTPSGVRWLGKRKRSPRQRPRA